MGKKVWKKRKEKDDDENVESGKDGPFGYQQSQLTSSFLPT